MTRLLVGLVLLAHGLVHAGVYMPGHRFVIRAPFDPGRSWVLSAVHVPPDVARDGSVRLAGTCAAAFILAGVALLAGAAWWAPVAMIASIGAAVLKVLYFHPWLTAGVALDMWVIVAIAGQWPASLF